MRKRLLSALVAAALGMTMVWVGTASSAPTEIPATVQIEDRDGDATHLNDQGLGDEAGFQGDQGGLSLIHADLLKVWFTNDADTISANIQTTAQPPAPYALFLAVRVNPPADSMYGCLSFETLIPGTNNTGEGWVELFDECAGETVVEGTVTFSEGPEETGVTTITIPRSGLEALADGAVLTGPTAYSKHGSGGPPAGTVVFPTIDNTKVGTDYTITAEQPQGSPKKCPSKGGKKGKARPRPRPTPRPTTSATPSAGTTTRAPDPEMMFQTPTPSASPTGKPTAPPGQQKPCPRQQGKNKPRPPKPRPSRTPNPPSSNPTPTASSS